jgi:hypothetical protein
MPPGVSGNGAEIPMSITGPPAPAAVDALSHTMPPQPNASLPPGGSGTASVPRRDKSLSALSHELIARYGYEWTVIDLDDVQVCPPPRRHPP